MQITRITRAPYTFTLPSSFSGAEAIGFSLLPKRRGPDGQTVWLPADSWNPTTRVATITLSGPDADSTSALAITGGGDLWAADITAPLTDAIRVERVVVQDGPPNMPTTVLLQALIGLDTDGTPFYDPAGIGSPTTVSLDIDAVPYFVA